MIARAPRQPELLTPNEIAALYRVGSKTVYEAIRAGTVRSTTRQRAGRECYLVSRVDAERVWGAS